MHTICLVEDEERLRKLLVLYLEKEGYKTIACASAEEAFGHLYDTVSLWILDIMLPGADGFELIKRIKEINEDVPVIFASARDSEMDRIMGLRFGSDDYITKPFSVQELILRIEKLLKRVYRDDVSLLHYAVYTINLTQRSVFEGSLEVRLTSREFDLLVMLCRNVHKTFSRQDILSSIWGDTTENSDRVVDDTIRRLRKKIVHLKLETIYGFGYRLL